MSDGEGDLTEPSDEESASAVALLALKAASGGGFGSDAPVAGEARQGGGAQSRLRRVPRF